MSQPPRLLVLSASVGAGHLRAAQAVELALRELAPHAEIRNIDLLELTNVAFRQFYGKAYLDLVNRAPHLLGYFYDMLDKPRRANSTRDRLRVALERFNLGKFIKLLGEKPWDLAINTHFLPAEIIASLRKKGQSQLRHVTVTTDFETHRLWVNQPCEHYFTATDEGARYLHHWGVPESDTTISGIPIHPVFAKPKEQATCRARHGIGSDRPVVLQLAGGFGVGPILQLFDGLLRVAQPIELVVVAGRNVELKADLEKRCQEHTTPHKVHVLGFTDQIDELMAAADLVISKPGGLTTSEVLARGTAMVIVNPIPGQESRNSDFLLENGAAIKVNQPAMMAAKVEALLADPARLQALRTRSAQLGHPQAAYTVARAALAMVGVKV